MKKCNLILSILSMALLIIVSGCSEMDDTYSHFLESGKIKYAGKADYVQVIPGNNRLSLTWPKSSDPSVTKAKIYWNNRTDSMEVEIDRTQDQITVPFENMPEGNHSFEIITFDDEGNRSVVVEITGRSYGSVYQNTLLTRIVESTNWLAENRLSVRFAPVTDTTLVNTEFIYESESDIYDTMIITPDMDSVVIEDFPRGQLKYRSTFKPHPNALDTFNSRYDSIYVKGLPVELDKSDWTITASSFDNRSGASYRPPINLLDNNRATIWVNNVQSGLTYPHWVEVDMQEIKEIEGLTLQPRQNDTAARPKNAEMQTSIDGEDWVSHGDYFIDNINDNQFFEFSEPPVSARFFKIIIKEPHRADNNVAVAEVGAYTR